MEKNDHHVHLSKDKKCSSRLCVFFAGAEGRVEKGSLQHNENNEAKKSLKLNGIEKLHHNTSVNSICLKPEKIFLNNMFFFLLVFVKLIFAHF